MTTRNAILGPLTTTWTPPETCASTIIPCHSGCNVGWLAQSCIETDNGSGYWIHEAVECFPPRTVGVKTPDNSMFDDWGVYSPGLACPAGMTSHVDCLSTYGVPNTKMALGASVELRPGETAAGCCPSGFQCYQTPLKPECVMFITTAFVATVCDSDAIITTMAPAAPVTIITDGVTTMQSYYFIEAPMIQLVWHSSDLSTVEVTAITPGSTSPSVFSATASGTGTAGPTTLAAASSASATDSSAMSEVSKVGIGVGVGLGAVVLLLGVALLELVRRHRRRAAVKRGRGIPRNGLKTSYTHSSGFGELASPSAVYELEHHHQVVELENPSNAHRMI